MNNDFIVINFSRNLYTKKAIKESTKAYKELANFDIKETKDYIKVNLKNIDKDIKDIIRDEFCNYVLSAMRSL